MWNDDIGLHRELNPNLCDKYCRPATQIEINSSEYFNGSER